jgi:hypothetical protein
MAQQQNRNNNDVNDARRTATMAGRNVGGNQKVSYLLNNLCIYKIEDPQLPMVKVDQERVDNGAKCTTCLETFTLDEEVAKLKCQVSHTE